MAQLVTQRPAKAYRGNSVRVRIPALPRKVAREADRSRLESGEGETPQVFESPTFRGGLAEWLNALVLKTCEA